MENTTDLRELVALKRGEAIHAIRQGLMERIQALQNQLNNLNEYELLCRPLGKNDETLASIVDKTDEKSFWPLIRELLDAGYIHEFYDTTPPDTYPFGPGRINASPSQGIDSPRLAQAVRKKWHVLMQAK